MSQIYEIPSFDIPTFTDSRELHAEYERRVLKAAAPSNGLGAFLRQTTGFAIESFGDVYGAANDTADKLLGASASIATVISETAVRIATPVSISLQQTVDTAIRAKESRIETKSRKQVMEGVPNFIRETVYPDIAYLDTIEQTEDTTESDAPIAYDADTSISYEKPIKTIAGVAAVASACVVPPYALSLAGHLAAIKFGVPVSGDTVRDVATSFTGAIASTSAAVGGSVVFVKTGVDANKRLQKRNADGSEPAASWVDVPIRELVSGALRSAKKN